MTVPDPRDIARDKRFTVRTAPVATASRREVRGIAQR
jgi:hypothetical protein